mmetsp:Transcript_49097/g.123068  ORF Transcript_49097/g.123068 Transcript_49097/m.123068 type:complete len:158 (-) Transcript_49097:175-648(-)
MPAAACMTDEGRPFKYHTHTPAHTRTHTDTHGHARTLKHKTAHTRRWRGRGRGRERPTCTAPVCARPTPLTYVCGIYNQTWSMRERPEEAAHVCVCAGGRQRKAPKTLISHSQETKQATMQNDAHRVMRKTPLGTDLDAQTLPAACTSHFTHGHSKK